MASRRTWFATGAGAILAIWALAAWLTVIPDADRLADGIQVQSLLTDPRLVLAFPGQTHGGVLEYPFLLLAEWVAPGNYFAHSAIRIVVAFFTGFFAARLFLRVYPQGSRWAFLAAVAAGPAVMNALTGPQENPVGVMWIHANYPQSWLLATMGASLLADAVADRDRIRSWRLVAAGLVMGLGVYEQPGVLLLAVPLISLIMMRYPRSVRVWAIAASGAVVGAALLSASFLLHHRQSVYNPAHLPRPDLAATAAVLGLDGIPSYVSALLPAGLGVAPVDGSILQRMAAVWVPVFVVVVLVATAVSAWRSFKEHRVSPILALTLPWTIALMGLTALSWTLAPVWFYGACLGVLLWITVGALPAIVPRPWGTILAIVAVALMASSTLVQAVPWYANSVDHFRAKVDRMSQMQQVADALVESGATTVFGSYHDVLPIAYAAGGRLHPSAIYYDRFPLGTDAEALQSVFVNVTPTEYHGVDAAALVKEKCEPTGTTVASGDFTFESFDCPVDVISPKR